MRIQTATPPTPIRLDVLDLIDMLDATARELWRCLDGIDALDWRKDKRNEDLKATLIACAGHPRLATFADAGFYMHVVDGIARKVDAALDPPEQRREIGTCELCETMLTAGAADQWVTCPVCGREQRAQTVKLRRLKTLCWDDSRRGSAAEIAKAFCDLLDAEIFSRHCLPFLPDNPARPSTFRTHLPVRSGMRWPARG